MHFISHNNILAITKGLPISPNFQYFSSILLNIIDLPTYNILDRENFLKKATCNINNALDHKMQIPTADIDLKKIYVAPLHVPNLTCNWQAYLSDLIFGLNHDHMKFC